MASCSQKTQGAVTLLHWLPQMWPAIYVPILSVEDSTPDRVGVTTTPLPIYLDACSSDLRAANVRARCYRPDSETRKAGQTCVAWLRARPKAYPWASAGTSPVRLRRKAARSDTC